MLGLTPSVLSKISPLAFNILCLPSASVASGIFQLEEHGEKLLSLATAYKLASFIAQFPRAKKRLLFKDFIVYCVSLKL